jgi:hypothetical protein
MLPSPFHVVERWEVRIIATCHSLFQVSVLGFDDLVSGASVEFKPTRPTQLLARHRFHVVTVLSPRQSGFV